MVRPTKPLLKGKFLKKTLNLSQLWCHRQKIEISNFLYFLIETEGLSKSSEGLNSSLAQSADELWLSAKMAKVMFYRIWFFTKNLVLGPYFWDQKY